MRPWLVLLPAMAAVATALVHFPEWVQALVVVPAMLFAPGWGLARQLGDDPVLRAVDAVWISAVLSVPAVLAGALTGGGAWVTLAVATAFAWAGAAVPARRARALDPRVRLGVLAVLVAVAATAWDWRGAIARPLDRYWWNRTGDEGFSGHVADPGFGWAEQARIDGAWRLVPKTAEPFLLGPADGVVLFAMRGPVGATLHVGDADAIVKADVVEDPAEGSVPRYLQRGVASLAVPLHAVAGEQIPLRFSHPEQSVLYVVPDTDALWALHARGELRFVHYYQILNMVEQVRWARELYRDRRVTDVQPPLWSYVSAGPLAWTGGDLPTQNVVFVGLLAAVGIAGVAALRAWAPGAPLAAWLLPAGACLEHAKLMLEPASAGMPDTLYTLAVLGIVAGLASEDRRYAAQSLLAQLSRYPGTLVGIVAALWAGRPARAARMTAGVLVVAALFALGGLASGSLDGWIETVRWETGPEHWHGEGDPRVLLSRVPGFYALWVAYAGGLPVLAALRWPKGTRVAFGTALAYSLLLCTIDHRPSHYFLPLLHLSAVGASCTAAAFRARWARLLLPILGLGGLLYAYGVVPVSG